MLTSRRRAARSIADRGRRAGRQRRHARFGRDRRARRVERVDQTRDHRRVAAGSSRNARAAGRGRSRASGSSRRRCRRRRRRRPRCPARRTSRRRGPSRGRRTRRRTRRRCCTRRRRGRRRAPGSPAGRRRTGGRRWGMTTRGAWLRRAALRTRHGGAHSTTPARAAGPSPGTPARYDHQGDSTIPAPPSVARGGGRADARPVGSRRVVRRASRRSRSWRRSRSSSPARGGGVALAVGGRRDADRGRRRADAAAAQTLGAGGDRALPDVASATLRSEGRRAGALSAAGLPPVPDGRNPLPDVWRVMLDAGPARRAAPSLTRARAALVRRCPRCRASRPSASTTAGLRPSMRCRAAPPRSWRR